jgi:ATP-binding cassette subfamily B protein
MIGRTTFIIAHRLSTVRHADHILVLARGAIVERGSHDELMRRGGAYRQLYDAQMRETSRRRVRAVPPQRLEGVS